MNKLFKSAYFTKKNKHITNSKVGDFLRSKEIYKKKHIDHTWKKELTAPMILGKMVDEVICTGQPPKGYQVKVLKKDNEDLYEAQKSVNPELLISQDTYDKAMTMGLKVRDSNIGYWLKFHKAKYQVLLTSFYQAIPVAGILDSLIIQGDTATVIDFKTANAAAFRTTRSWFWHCIELGYFRQLAHYGQLVRDNYPVKKIKYIHIVISSSKDDNYPVKVYELDEYTLDFKKELEIFEKTAKDIVNETLFIDPVPSFTDPIKLNIPYGDNTVLETTDQETES